MGECELAEDLVTIVIPTRQSSDLLESVLISINQQEYPYIETVVVCENASDSMLQIGEKYSASIVVYNPQIPDGFFDAPHRRNYGVSRSHGAFIYYVDSDMYLSPRVVSDAVGLCNNGADAVIVPEQSFGTGIWAKAKGLERQCYLGDDNIEAPRFLKRSVWESVGGLDEALGGGGDDWDLREKLKERGYKIARTSEIVFHDEGDLRIGQLLRKRFRYGRDVARYLKKRPKASLYSFFPVRKGFIVNWRLFVRSPLAGAAFVLMRTAEYGAGLFGILHSLIFKVVVNHDLRKY